MQVVDPISAVPVGTAPALPSHPLERIRDFAGQYAVSLLSTVLLLAAWEVVSQARLLPKFLLPAPTEIVAAGVQYWPLLVADTWVTLYEIVLGFVAGSAVGLLIAIGIVFSRIIEQAVYPPAIVTQMVPKLAIAPLFVVWFGVGVTPKIMITILICLFPVLVNAVAGMRAVDPRMLDLMHSVNASRWQIFTKVEFPNSAPYVFAGLKVGITLAVVGAIVGEWLGSNIGLGYRILAANSALRTELLFAALVALSVVGILLFGAVALLEHLVVPRQQRVHGAADSTL
jgi:NitT/TauT family transport system permease protein